MTLTTFLSSDMLLASKALYQLFYSDKEAIEIEFGGALEWNELPDGKESYVTVTKEKADFRNENDWSSQFNWLAERLEKLDTVIRKRVRKVELE